jgi:diaminopimelate epimerase
MAAIAFTKMQGAGNDFVVLDTLRGAPLPDAALARRLADRHYGVGCDQIMVVTPATRSGCRYGYRIYNADGSEAGQCGNGARCIARYLARVHDLQSGERLDSPAGAIAVAFTADGEVELAMGLPRFDPAAVPFLAAREAPRHAIEVAGADLEIAVVSMGNPHAVLVVDAVRSAAVERIGPALATHPRFPEGTNVGFVERVDRSHVRLRVYERGVGETLACGSGACAAVVALRVLGELDESVEVDLPGGRLRVSWPGPGAPVRLAGPAEFVFEGTLSP